MLWDVNRSVAILYGLIYFTSISSGLECWLCIADNCDKPPSSNILAAVRSCNVGESCQKVFYRALDRMDNMILESTIRSCSSGGCVERNDFTNCTTEKLVLTGCVQHKCCNDRNMCNDALAQRDFLNAIIPALVLLVAFLQIYNA